MNIPSVILKDKFLSICINTVIIKIPFLNDIQGSLFYWQNFKWKVESVIRSKEMPTHYLLLFLCGRNSIGLETRLSTWSMDQCNKINTVVFSIFCLIVCLFVYPSKRKHIQKKSFWKPKFLVSCVTIRLKAWRLVKREISQMN